MIHPERMRASASRGENQMLVGFPTISKTAGTSNGVKAVLFDIDGVLVDSFEAGLRFFQDILAFLGYPKPGRRAYKEAFHLPFVPALKHLAKAELTEELERIHDITQKIPYHSELLTKPPDVKETLAILGKKYTLGIVTSRRKESVERRYFPFAHTEKYFSVLVTADDCQNNKPHPEPLLLAAKRLGVKPNECVYIGDSSTDIEAGRAAGMKTILYGKKKDRDADASTTSFRKLPMLISSI